MSGVCVCVWLGDMSGVCPCMARGGGEMLLGSILKVTTYLYVVLFMCGPCKPFSFDLKTTL
jgi:hypothetical protein